MTAGIDSFLNLDTPEKEVEINVKTSEDNIKEVYDEALQSYKDIKDLGQNVNPERSAKLFEVAKDYLKLALDAAKEKAEYED
jgi:hypothetical protein